LHIDHLVAVLSNLFRGAIAFEGYQQSLTVRAGFDQAQLEVLLTKVQNDPGLEALREVGIDFHEHFAVHAVSMSQLTHG
jgi:hypothetical protein